MIKIMTEDKNLTVKVSKEDSDSLFNQLALTLLDKTNGLTEVSLNPPKALDTTETNPVKTKKEPVKMFPKSKEDSDEHNGYANNRYGGFLYIKCKHCGKIRGFCSKTAVDSYTCSCGETLYFSEEDIVPMIADCPNCGSHFKYHTNIVENSILYDCLKCGSPIDLEYNTRRKQYNTVE